MNIKYRVSNLRIAWNLYRWFGDAIWKIALLFDAIRLREHLSSIQEWERIHNRPYPIISLSLVSEPALHFSKTWIFCVRWYGWWIRRYYGLCSLYQQWSTDDNDETYE